MHIFGLQLTHFDYVKTSAVPRRNRSIWYVYANFTFIPVIWEIKWKSSNRLIGYHDRPVMQRAVVWVGVYDTLVITANN